MEFFVAALAALAAWELIAIAALIILMVIGCSLDRTDRVSFKWWVVGLFTAGYAFLAWRAGSLPSWQDITAAMLINVGLYLGIGVLYSVIEFVLEVRKSTRRYGALWQEYLVELKSKAQSEKAPLDLTNPEHLENAANRFVVRYSSKSNIINVATNTDDATKLTTPVVPKINRILLSRFIGAWTIFWPFYAISLIIGDLLIEVFNFLGDVFAKLSGRFVRMAFKNTFKV